MSAEAPLRPAWLRALALAALSLALTVYAWSPMLAAYPHTSKGDGTMYQKILEAGRASIVRYHEFPFWNPYECGGYPLWDNPQGFAGAPLLWTVFLVNSTVTIYIWVITHVAFAFASMWLFARHEVKLSRAATFVAAAAWAYSGFHQQHYAGGHFTFVPWVFFPLALLLWRRAENDVRHAVGLGVLVAWMFYEGAVYPLPHLVLVLGAETLTRIWSPRRLPQILRAGAIVGVVAFPIAASRLLPVLDQLRQHSRPALNDVDAITWPTLKAMFLARQHGREVIGQQYVWTEWGAYLGPIVLTLGLLGIVVGGAQTAWMAALLAFAFALMCGHFAKWAPWSLLTAHVPPFKEMRVPSRFRATVLLFLAAYAGIAVDRLLMAARRWVPSRPWSRALQTLVLAIALIGVGDIIGVGIDTIPQFFTSPPLTKPEPAAHFYYGGPGLAGFLDQPAQNRGEPPATTSGASARVRTCGRATCRRRARPTTARLSRLRTAPRTPSPSMWWPSARRAGAAQYRLRRRLEDQCRQDREPRQPARHRAARDRAIPHSRRRSTAYFHRGRDPHRPRHRGYRGILRPGRAPPPSRPDQRTTS